ncbi:hypothetical protein [Polyangium sp. 15x6]|uniref:hypothetical protein n=1 Tax=Polyangium sp. 15x6 TaxID=3042687 RepID=UPI00249A710A|nr:hypothetical protein [Polyangium sp. 15x6]MDI3284727.1 hypothetical protein [Polyangium sp. 15x6]
MTSWCCACTGYSPEARPIFSHPVLTEDDHSNGLLGERPPQWLEELLSRPRIQPGLFLGLSVLDWRNRLLLRWLYDQRPAPKDSLVILRPDADPREPEIWDSGGGLSGTARIAAIADDPVHIAREIERGISRRRQSRRLRGSATRRMICGSWPAISPSSATASRRRR